MNIKLCGLKTIKDVEIACSLRVWAIGFVLTKSPRMVSVRECSELSVCASNNDNKIKRIGVFSNEPSDFIINAMRKCNLNFAQIHGIREEREWQKLSEISTIRAFNISKKDKLSILETIDDELFLLDSSQPGSGNTFDWEIAKKASQYGKIIVAGGLNKDNVGDAIKLSQPWGVDVSSGIEIERGQKNHNLMKEFVEVCRAGQCLT